MDALAADERMHWDRTVAAGRAVSETEAVAVEERTARVVMLTGRSPAPDDRVLVRTDGGRTRICPLDLSRRLADALDSLRASLPGPLVDTLVPDDDPRRVLAGGAAAAARPPQIRTAAWAVPLAWFVLFDPDVEPATEGSLLTTVGAARRRLDRALDIVEFNLEDDEFELELVELFDWLEGFDRETLLVLDFVRVAAGHPELERDRTCRDLWRALEALADGDELAAVAYYGLASARWATLRERQRAS